jgi:hypothetical protein
MNKIFYKPIGTMSDLGTTRQWALDVVRTLLVTAVLVLLYVLS